MIGWKGYNFMQSDWSATPKLDYATNSTVANYFGAESKKYQMRKFERFYNWGVLVPDVVGARLLEGDTVKIGVDYYGSLGVARQLIPDGVLRQIDFTKGEVKYFNVFITNNQLSWEGE